jgi:hypothetical protein
MKSNNKSLMLIFSLFLAVMFSVGLGPGDVRADDVDVYMTTAQNTAHGLCQLHVVVARSGSGG